MNPTVSVKRTSLPLFSCIFLVIGSNVENSLSSAATFAEESLLSNVLLPALVYPTREIIGKSAVSYTHQTLPTTPYE